MCQCNGQWGGVRCCDGEWHNATDRSLSYFSFYHWYRPLFVSFSSLFLRFLLLLFSRKELFDHRAVQPRGLFDPESAAERVNHAGDPTLWEEERALRHLLEAQFGEG